MLNEEINVAVKQENNTNLMFLCIFEGKQAIATD